MWHPISIYPIGTINILALIVIDWVLYSVSFEHLTKKLTNVRNFFHFLAISSLFTLTVEVVNKIVGNGKIYGFTLQRPHAFAQFINTNFAATLLGATFLIYLSFSLERNRRENQIKGLSISGIIFAALILTLSRAGIVFTFLLSLVIIERKIKKIDTKKEKIFTAFIITLAIIYESFNFTLPEVRKEIASTSGSAVTHWELVDSTLSFYTHFPLFGGGLGSLTEGFHFFPLKMRVTLENDDCDPAQWLAEGGIITFAIILYFLLWNIKFEKDKKKKLPRFYRNHIFSIDLALTYVLLQSFTTYPFYFPFTSYLFFTLLGIRNGILYKKKKLKNSSLEKNPRL